jgi:diguanylate cyclase
VASQHDFFAISLKSRRTLPIIIVMRYNETRDRSLEILRQALPLMSRQRASFHPLSFTLWYEHIAGSNPELTRVLEARLAASVALTDDDVQRLYAQHVAARDVKVLEALQQRLRSVLEDTAQSAATASAEAAQFDRTLQEHMSQVSSQMDGDALKKVIGDLVHDAQHMHTIAFELSRKLETSTREVSLLTESLQKTQSEALLDSLTGLKNRRGLERAVEHLLTDPSGLAGSALLLADIDDFKTINDTFGHVLGDKVIRSVSHVLQTSIKGRDVAARFGGDEFAVLLPQTTLAGAATLAEQIRELVARGRIHRADGRESVGEVTLSVGVAVAVKGETLESLIERADIAMYAAKRSGRNRVSLAAQPDGNVAAERASA